MADVTMCAHTKCASRYQCVRHPSSGSIASKSQSFARFGNWKGEDFIPVPVATYKCDQFLEKKQ